MLHAGLDLSRRKVDVCLLSGDGEIVEDATPQEFFSAPKSNRAKDFLGKILTH